MKGTAMPLIRPIMPQDYEDCLAIYNDYVKNSLFTLEITPLTLSDFSERAERIRKAFPYYVCEADGNIVGYCYLDHFNPREGYRYACDVSIYTDRSAQGKGYAHSLYQTVEQAAREKGFRTVFAIITDVNERSRRFHASHGFSLAAHFPRIAEKNGTVLGSEYWRKDLTTE